MPAEPMMAVQSLVEKAKAAFAVLERVGFKAAGVEIVTPESFKGGFELAFRSASGMLALRYLDMEFEATLGGREIFGCGRHPGFAGNMFSREHLSESLPRLAEVLQIELSGRDSVRA